jgi:hypothetical protein
LGQKVTEPPYQLLSVLSTIFYFLYFFLIALL